MTETFLWAQSYLQLLYECFTLEVVLKKVLNWLFGFNGNAQRYLT